MKTLAFSLFMAVLGLSYALATRSDAVGNGGSSVEARQAGARSVGTPLRFTNAYLAANVDPAYTTGGNTASDPQGFDLGDAVQGQTVTRYLTAAGGGAPYAFKTFPNFAFLGSTQPPPVPKLVAVGKITDTFNFANGTFGSFTPAARFNAVVTDYLGTQRTGTFRLNLYPPARVPAFRFAQDFLPRGQLGNTYFTNISTVGAKGSATYSVVAGSVSANGTAVANLESVGLTLTSDGLLFGRPSFSRKTNAAMSITFIAQAIDGIGALALARNNGGINQTFTLGVDDNLQATSEILALTSTMQLNSAVANEDSFTYTGIFDPKGMTLDSLAGSPFTVHINGAAYSGSFDAKGKIKAPLAGKKGTLNVAISTANATVSVRLTGASLAAAANPTKAAGKTNLPIVLAMEFVHYRACEALTMSGRGAGTRLALSYLLARGVGKSMAGGLQIINVNGKDGKYFDGTKGSPGIPGDAWFVRWAGVPRYSIDAGASKAFPVRDPKLGNKQTGSVTAMIRIGQYSQANIGATILSNRLIYKAKPVNTTVGVYQLTLDPMRFIHSVYTNPIAPSDSNIPLAINSKSTTIFFFGMDITGYSGETGRVIAPNQYSWLER